MSYQKTQTEISELKQDKRLKEKEIERQREEIEKGKSAIKKLESKIAETEKQFKTLEKTYESDIGKLTQVHIIILSSLMSEQESTLKKIDANRIDSNREANRISPLEKMKFSPKEQLTRTIAENETFLKSLTNKNPQVIIYHIYSSFFCFLFFMLFFNFNFLLFQSMSTSNLENKTRAVYLQNDLGKVKQQVNEKSKEYMKLKTDYNK